MIATIFPFLDTLIPACAAFGPFFLVMGIIYRTSARRETHPKTTKAYLVAGAIMITLVLLQTTPMGIPAPPPPPIIHAPA